MADKTLDILKQAILLERRGMAFYGQVAEKAEDAAVKNFFETMAAEEQVHVGILEAVFQQYAGDGTFNPADVKTDAYPSVSDKVLSEDLVKRIAAAGFEAAAVSAAMAMEERAISLYGGRAGTAENEKEKELYNWLVAWERTHLAILAEIDKEITERVWNDNGFWPF